MADDQRRSSGLLIPIVLLIGLGGAASFVWWRARSRVPEGFAMMPLGTPRKVAQLVAEGDRLYLEAMDHEKNSDPQKNPGWPAENRKALELFNGSRDSYIAAQDEYNGGRVPTALLDRVREAIQHQYFCRKRAVSAERQ